MKVRMLTGLQGPEINLAPGDIHETDEGARWCAAGIAEPVAEVIETAAKPVKRETATTRKPKVAK